MSLENRIKRLEVERRWFRVLFAAMAIASVVPWLMGNRAAVTEVVRAKSFALMDDDGHTRGLWAIDSKGTCKLMVMGDTRKNPPVISLVAGPDSADTVVEKDGQPQLVQEIVVAKEIQLVDENGDTRGRWAVEEDGSASLFILGDKSLAGAPSLALVANKKISKVRASEGQFVATKDKEVVFVEP